MAARSRIILACHLAGSGLAVSVGSAHAQSLSEIAGRMDSLQQELQTQRSLIEAQAARIEEQRAELERLRGQVIAASGQGEQQRAEIERLRDQVAALTSPGVQPAAGAAQGEYIPSPNFALESQRATGVPQMAQASDVPGPKVQRAAAKTAAGAPLPEKPVGEAPELPRVEQQVQAVPEGTGVLLRPGKLTIEPAIEFTNTSSNRLVFRGVELVVGLPLGVIEASDVDRNTFVSSIAVRYGLAKNIEIEARVPFMIRSDRFKVSQQRDNQVVTQLGYDERHLGDIEFALRYQINRPVGQKPIFVGSVRVKSTTGLSPYAIPFDSFNIPTGLATGSGFWAVQPGIQMLLPSDPVVIFAGASYMYHMPKTIARTVGQVNPVTYGRVDPGDSINANLGFGFSLNPRFSFSLGYRHTYIFPTTTEINGAKFKSSHVQIGALSLGMSYRLSEQQSINFGVDIGATADAPNVSLSVRMPLSF